MLGRCDVENIGTARSRVHQFYKKMATSAAGDLVCDEFAILENNLFEEDTDFNLQLEHFSKDIIESEENTVFQCNLCAKVCKSQRGLSRHITSKHKFYNCWTYRNLFWKVQRN